MQIVGVDFGTTNVRIATWDSEQDLPPQSKHIGLSENPTLMPAVVALRRQANGEVSIIVGEDAEDLEQELDDTTLVVDIAKRFAMSTDQYVRWHLDCLNAQDEEMGWPPEWWNPETLCVEKWGQAFPVWDLIHSILAEAFRRADITGEYEWRAGCPVHSDFRYRTELAGVLSRITGKGSAKWIVEEPILFLIAARKLGDLREGSYLVYDIGGGSFDCALVELAEPDQQMLIYGANGHPLLGGTDIDKRLKEKLSHSGLSKVLRKAKEDRTPASPSETLGDGTVVTLESVNAVLKEIKFAEKSVSVLRDSYISAKTLWKRDGSGGAPPLGEILHKNRDTGEVSFVWQLKWNDLAADVDGIILFGGPTKSPFFKEYLEALFGAGKVILAEDLLEGVEEAALTGASIGACYSAEADFDQPAAEREYTPLYVNRLPVRVTLEDLRTGAKVQYEPYQHFAPSLHRPFDAFVSGEELSEQPDDPYSNERYEVTVSTPDDIVLEQCLVDPKINTRLIGSRLRLVIDLFGQVAVQQRSKNASAKEFVVIDNTPWQTPEQAQHLRDKLEQDKQYRDEEDSRVFGIISQSPFITND